MQLVYARPDEFKKKTNSELLVFENAKVANHIVQP